MLSKRLQRILSVLVVLALLAVFGASVSTGASAASSAERETNGIIAFLTDWGTRDFYVGAVKGVALSIFPEATLVDITHEVEPYNIMEGAVTLLLAAREYPAGTVFVAIVDPGVGTERRPIVLRTEDDKFFVGPDNGLFTFVAQEFGVKAVYQITNKDFMRPGPISFSFHGRDIFTPTAARIAAGRKASDVGPAISDFVVLDVKPARLEDGKLIGEVVLVDQYGNMQANISRDLVAKLGLKFNDKVRVTVGDKTIESRFVNTYGDVPEGSDLIFVASTEWVEISVNMGSAKDRFGGDIGSQVIIEKAE